MDYIKKFDREKDYREFDAARAIATKYLKVKAVKEIMDLSTALGQQWTATVKAAIGGRRKGVTRAVAEREGRAFRLAVLQWDEVIRQVKQYRWKMKMVFRKTGSKVRNAWDIAGDLERSRRLAVSMHFSRFNHGVVTVTWGALPRSDAREMDDSHEHYAGVEVESEKTWTLDGKLMNWPAMKYHVRVRAQKLYKADMPAQWDLGLPRHTQNRIGGNRNIDGLITLTAKQVPSPDGEVRAWEASWARRSRGIAWNVIHGAIVEAPDGTCVHGATVKSALSNLKRRQTRSQRSAAVAVGMDLPEVIQKYGERRLNWRIARSAGLCADGITGWVMEHFPDLDPRKDSITVKQALATRSSESLVLRAIEAASRRWREAS